MKLDSAWLVALGASLIELYGRKHYWFSSRVSVTLNGSGVWEATIHALAGAKCDLILTRGELRRVFSEAGLSPSGK